MREVEQKLDLLSEETNQGLIALETVAQALSNQQSSTEVAEVLVNAVVASFEGVQASVHLLAANESELAIVAEAGRTELSPAPLLALGEGLPGRVAAELVQQPDLATFDLEPETELTPIVKGISMVCPLVAGGRFLGVLHLVMPDELARYYLYNRAPMTLAHHAAAALHATDASRQLDAIAAANRG